MELEENLPPEAAAYVSSTAEIRTIHNSLLISILIYLYECSKHSPATNSLHATMEKGTMENFVLRADGFTCEWASAHPGEELKMSSTSPSLKWLLGLPELAGCQTIKPQLAQNNMNFKESTMKRSPLMPVRYLLDVLAVTSKHGLSYGSNMKQSMDTNCNLLQSRPPHTRILRL